MKLKILCGLLAVILSSACVVFVMDNDDGGTVVPPPVGANLISTKYDRPSDGNPSAYSAKENLYIAHGELLRSGGFSAKSYGTTTTLGVSQPISADRVVLDGAVFKQSVSYSSLVKMAEQRYTNGSDYILRESLSVNALDNVQWKDTAMPLSQKAYMDRYGHTSSELTGYILNDETIVQDELVSVDDGVYTFRYVLDETVAPYYMLYEMRTSAGVSKLPVFYSAELTLKMDSNWTVISLDTKASYKVALIGGVTCNEQMTETFHDIGKVTQLPETEFFSQYFGAATVDPLPQEVNATTVLMNIFQPYLSADAKPLDVALTIGSSDSWKPIASGYISAEIDMQNLANTRAAASIAGIDLVYDGGKVNLSYNDFKASVSVNDAVQKIGGLLAQFGTDALLELDTDKLLASITFDLTDDYCQVDIPLSIGGVDLYAQITADINDGVYTFTGATARIGKYTLTLTPVQNWDVPQLDGEYPDALGLLGILDGTAIAFTGDVNGTQLLAQYDLLRGAMDLHLGELSAYCRDGVIYANYGNAAVKLGIEDIPRLIEKLTPLLGETQLPQINTNSILGNLSFESDQNDANLQVEIAGFAVRADFTVMDGSWILSKISCNYDGIEAELLPQFALQFEDIDTSSYTDVAEVADEFWEPVMQIVQSQNRSVKIGAAFETDGDVYYLDGQVLADGNNNVNALLDLYHDGSLLLKGNICKYGNTLYLDINGVKTCLTLEPSSRSNLTFANTLSGLYGYHPCLDLVLDAVVEVIGAFEGDINYIGLLKSLTFRYGEIGVEVNGEQLNLPDFSVGVSTREEALLLTLGKFTLGKFTLTELTAEVVSVDQTVTVPADGYTLGLRVEIDKENILHASIDIINNVYRFRMGELFAEYSSDTLYIKYGDTFIRGDINKIKEIIAEIKNLADNNTLFASSAESDGGLLDNLLKGSFDVKTITQSITLSYDDALSRAYLKANVLGLNVTAAVITGDNPQIEVTVPVTFIDRTLKVTAEQVDDDFYAFAPSENYISIETVFDEYFPVLEKAVTTNSWHFDLSADIITQDVSYKLKNSSVELIYRSSGDFELAANITVMQKTDKQTEYSQMMSLAVSYVDGRVFVDYNGLKLSVAWSAIENCVGLVPDLFRAVPQIKDAYDAYVAARETIKGNTQSVDYSTIIEKMTYINGVVNLVLNGNLFLSELGSIDLTIGKTSDTLSLNVKDFVYTSTDDDGNKNSLKVNFDVSVLPQTQQAGKAAIGSPDKADYIDLDSIYQLLSAFIATADDGTYLLKGTVPVHLVAIGFIEIDLTLGVEVRVDVEKIDGKDVPFVTFKLSRGKLDGIKKAAFADVGGDGYIYYNGLDKTVTFTRNSYREYTWCTKNNTYDCSEKYHLFNHNTTFCHEKHTKLNTEVWGVPEYSETVAAADFGGKAMDGIFKLINFSDFIDGKIKEAIANSKHDFGVEELIKDYRYVDCANLNDPKRTGEFFVGLTLAPVDKVLGDANVNIVHNKDFTLQKLYGDVVLLDVTGVNCKGTFDIALIAKPQAGLAKSNVTQLAVW
ncbi:MAG: hypothetical protein NC350_00020 [Corallococcus sp.]|nr:hypothetical protein [Corallococcus sp.]